jgi:hypothetical protein
MRAPTASAIRDIDDEFVGLIKARRNISLVPNLPDRGVATDLGWLRDSIPAGDLQRLQAAATDRPDAQKAFGIQAQNLARLSQEGVKIAVGTVAGHRSTAAAIAAKTKGQSSQ